MRKISQRFRANLFEFDTMDARTVTFVSEHVNDKAYLNTVHL